MDHLHTILENTPGHVRPGNQVDVNSFLSARNQEIQALLKEIQTPKKCNKMIFQRLPKKMRRRVMSTTVKRMPKDLRTAHKKSIEKQINKHVRRRKDYRRKPKSLRLDYMRRQKNGKWLETHVWFAKRFHIVLKDGYKLPKSSHDKTYRACYRAIGNHCLAQDVSYISCIELRGPYSQIIEGLMHHVNQDCGRTFKAKCYEQGTREGTIFMYKNGAYPCGAIGRVSFIWDTCAQDKIRAVWIWAEPSIYAQLAKELQITFNLKQNDLDILESEPPVLKKPKLLEIIKKSKNISTPAVQTFVNSAMKMTLLKDSLNRLRLTGPLSNSVLSRVLYPADLVNSNSCINKNWWSSHLKNLKSSINIQTKLWESLSGADRPESYPSNCVIGFHTVDPRLVFPMKRTKALPISKDFLLEEDYSFKLPTIASVSKIWDLKVRDWSMQNKMPNCEMNMLRSNCIINGNDKIALDKHSMSIIPIILIQRPGQYHPITRPGYGSGWDIVLPAGWAMPFWLGLIMNGCQPGGLRETTTMVLERCLPRPDEPDTDAGNLRAMLEKEEAMKKHFRLPPQMRVNYIKLGFQTPFHCPWDILCNEWMLDSNNKFVLRNIKVLTQLQNLTLNLKEKIDVNNLKSEFADLQTCLVPIRLELSQKGILKPNSHVCLPTLDDLSNVGDKSNLGPLEKMHKDLNAFKRKIYRLEHKKLLRSLRRKRVLEKKKRNILCKRFKQKVSPTSQIVKEYLSQMKKLWIPEEQMPLKHSCSRVILGFSCNSHFSFTKSKYVGIGYMPGPALLELFNLWSESKTNLPYVLIRNPSTNQFRYAFLSITI
ncbi:ribonucleases P/MRP protein subunit POP1 [Metopolophium dirhodum]|uniref:ribonucleases P/MRP protein subunit POP1 n=1 Tax=Metopolophium dirhodum TaxID=44670 RepID=UPI0029905A15|nr:ribonucleases P/MRP protein subunit POP1 [Metopolophium dirhodum]